MNEKPRTKVLGLKVSIETDVALDWLAESYESRTNALEHAVELMCNPEIAAVVGGGRCAHQQALLLLCDLLAPACREVEDKFDRAEWNLIADANNGCSPIFNVHGGALRHATGMVVTNVENNIKLDGGDWKWLGDDRKDAAKRGKQLVAKLAELNELQRWAVVLAVQFYWAHSQEIDNDEDAWWSLEFRQKIIQSGVKVP